MRDGHLNFCKVCRSAEAAEYRRRNTDRLRVKSAEWRDKNREFKRRIDAEYRARPGGKERQRAYNMQYYVRNSDHLRAYQSDYKARNPDAVRDRQTDYWLQNREMLLAKRAAYRVRNPDVQRRRDAIKHSMRSAQKKNSATVPFSESQLKAKFTYWGDMCWVCGGDASAVDHVKPLAEGGAHMLCNLRPICRTCNSAKNNKWPLPSRAKIMGLTLR